MVKSMVKRIPITANGQTYEVWTNSMGDNDDVKVLILHGGPGSCHHTMCTFDDYFQDSGYEYIYYDQLGSCNSDQPEDGSLWTIDRFVDEIEQVRIALNLNKKNFYLYGMSWGGVLALEYALKYQRHLKGLIVSNMQDSNRDGIDYRHNVLLPQMGAEFQSRFLSLLGDGKTETEEYQTMLREYMAKFFCRVPWDQMPTSVLEGFEHGNRLVEESIFGLNEFIATGNAADWSVKDRIHEIVIPTLFVASEYDMFDPKRIKAMSQSVKNGAYHICPNSGHGSLVDNPENYFPALIEFIAGNESG